MNRMEIIDHVYYEFPRTKEAVLKEIKIKINKYLAKVAAAQYDRNGYNNLLIITLRTFEDKVEQAVLFDALPDGWIYILDLSYDEFSLRIAHLKEALVSEHPTAQQYRLDAIYKLISFQPDMVSIEQYCKFYNTKSVTVRQWIRRGKIRTAYKTGNEWMIPMLTPLPLRGYEPAKYCWASGLDRDSFPEEYKFLADYNEASFFQDAEDKTKFHVLLSSKERSIGGETISTRLCLSVKEREKMELFMIASPQIRFCGIEI